MEEREYVKAACKVVGCRVKDLLHRRVELDDEEVVLIVGPVGYKRRVPFGDLDLPAPVTTKVEGVAPATFEEVFRYRIRAALETVGIVDFDGLKGKTDEELLAIEGVGQYTVETIRQALKRFE